MKNTRFNWTTLLVVIGLGTMVLLVRDFNSRMAELRRLGVEKEQIAAQVTDLVSTRSALETQVALATEGVILEEEARESKFSQEGDYPIILLEAESTPKPVTTTLVTLPEPVSRWELWQALFFDEPIFEVNIK